MTPPDSAVEPLGTASRSITTASTPASLAARAAQSPAAPAPMIRSGARAFHSPTEPNSTVLIAYVHSVPTSGHVVAQKPGPTSINSRAPPRAVVRGERQLPASN